MRNPLLFARLLNRPLAVTPGKFCAVMVGMGTRWGLAAPEGIQCEAGGPATERREQPKTEGLQLAVIPVLNTLVHRHGQVGADSGPLESYQRVGARIGMAARDPKVSGILLDIDSSGGEVDGLFELGEQIRAVGLSKPVFAVANSNAFSAAYAIASSANRVYVARNGGVGSIGVVAAHADQSGLDEQMGLKWTLVTAGDKKADLSPHGPLTDRARKDLQTQVDLLHGEFKASVVEGRPQVQMDRVGDASLWFGQEAVEVGLADRVGSLTVAAEDMVGELRGKEPETMSENQTAGSGSTAQNFNVQTTDSTAPSVTIPAPISGAPLQLSVPPGEAPNESALREELAELRQLRQEMAEEREKTRAEARNLEIVGLCRVAKRPEMAAGFIERKASIETVRKELFEAIVENETEGEIRTDAPSKSEGNHGWDKVLAARYGEEVLARDGARKVGMTLFGSAR